MRFYLDKMDSHTKACLAIVMELGSNRHQGKFKRWMKERLKKKEQYSYLCIYPIKKW